MGVSYVGGYACTNVGCVVVDIFTEGRGGAYYTGQRKWRLGFISPSMKKIEKML